MTQPVLSQPAGRSALILKFIKSFHDAHGYAPTRREIGKAVHLSTSVVSYHLAALQGAGRLTMDKGIARGIVLTEAPDEAEWAVMNRLARG